MSFFLFFYFLAIWPKKPCQSFDGDGETAAEALITKPPHTSSENKNPHAPFHPHFNTSQHVQLKDSKRKLDVPAPPVPDGLVVSDGLAAGEEVRMLPVDDLQIISAAHFHLLRLLLEQDLAAQLVKHDGVHLWPDIPPNFSDVEKLIKNGGKRYLYIRKKNLLGCVTVSQSLSCGTRVDTIGCATHWCSLQTELWHWVGDNKTHDIYFNIHGAH